MNTFTRAFVLLVAALPAYGTTTTVSTASGLQAAVFTAINGDTIMVANGTYNLTPTGGIGLNVTKSITIKSINGASNVTLTSDSAYIVLQINAPNVTIDGFTISSASSFGVATSVPSGNSLFGIVLRNLTVSVTGSNGQGITFSGVSNSIIELCTVTNTPFNSIGLSATSNGNLIINNTINNSITGHGIALTTSDYNIIAGNTISNTFFDGVSVNGSQYNYISQNKITLPHNGVTLTNFVIGTGAARQCIGNYIGNNSMLLSPTKAPGGSDPIWLNYDSNYNMVFGNEGSQASENGVAIYNSVGNYLRGNVFHDNPQGGIYIFNTNGDSGTTPPAYNSLQQNYLYMAGANGNILLDGAPNSDISFNYLAGPLGAQSTLGSTYGFLLRNSASNTTLVGNLIRDLAGDQIFSNNTGISLYLNRFLNASTHYTVSGAGVQWDSGSSVIGGNYFSDFTTANGNPSNGSTPYMNILAVLAPVDFTKYKDRYPYRSESLGKGYSIAPTNPIAGAQLAAGSSKNIAWSSTGCVLVDINLVGGSTTSVVSGAADYGNYRWTVPGTNVAPPGTYSLQMNCKDSSGNVQATGTSGQFTITPPDLLLLSPQTNQIIDYPNSLIISWTKTANVGPVNIYTRSSNSGTFTLLQSGVTNNFFRMTAPNTSSNQMSVMISSGVYGDSTDGTFTIRTGSSGSFTSPAASSSPNLVSGSPYELQWISPTGSTYVNIDLISGGTTKNIATQLADFGKYLMLVPVLPGSGAVLRITSFSSSGSTVGTTSSTSFTISTPPAQPSTMTAAAGTPQTVLAQTAFPTALQALVKDINSSPAAGIPVTFTAPLMGASGTFQGVSGCAFPCLAVTVVTNVSGIATAPTFQANGTAGGYTVVATSTVFGGSANFSLTNTAGGSPGYLAMFSSSNTLVNSVIFQSGNTVAIGGTSSLGAMTLIGSALSGDTAGMALYNSAGGAGASVSLDMYNTFANGGIPQAKIKALDDGAYSDHMTFSLKTPGSPTNPITEKVRITSTGRVGIGTTNPGAALEVAGSIRITGTGNGIIFPNGTTKSRGAVQGPARSRFGANSVNVGEEPAGLAFDGKAVWAVSGAGNSVTKLIAATGTKIGTYPVGSNPAGVVYDGFHVWVANSGSGTVSKLLAATGTKVGDYTVGTAPQGLAFDGEHIWVANSGSGEVTKLIAETGAIAGTFRVGGKPMAIAFDGIHIWVTNSADGTVSKLLAKSGATVGTYAAGKNPIGLAFDGKHIWVANNGSNDVTKLLAANGTAVATFGVGPNPRGIAFDGTNIWVNGESVTKLNPSTGEAVETYKGGGSHGIVFDGNGIWVANPGNKTVNRISNP